MFVAMATGTRIGNKRMGCCGWVYLGIDVMPMGGGGLRSERLPVTLADSTLSAGKSALIDYLNASWNIDYIQIEISMLGFIANEYI